MHFILIILISSFILITKAEYVFYKPVNNEILNISENEHQTIFNLVTKYTFPANQNPIFKDLHKNEISEILSQEETFLNKKLANQNINCIFLPNTLYELLTIYFWLQIKLIVQENFKQNTIYSSLFGFPRASFLWENKENFLTTGKFNSIVKDTLLKQFTLWGKNYTNDKVSELKTYELYHKLNSLDQLKKTHLIINNEIIQLLKQLNIHPSQLDLDNFEKILEFLMEHISSYFNNLRMAFTGVEPEYYLCGEGITENKLLSQIIKEETEAHKNGDFLLYRGTGLLEGRGNKIDSTLTYRNGEIRSNSISYGVTPFAGFFGNDVLYFGGAMAYSFILRSDFSYALKINKLKFYKNENFLNELFYMPPLNTLTALVCHSELFHARSRGAVNDHSDLLCGILSLNGVYFKIPSFLKIIKNKELHEKHFSDYLTKNILVLVNNTNFNIEELIANQLKKYNPNDYQNIDGNFSDLAWYSHITPNLPI